MMFLISSILAHYSTADFDQKPQSEPDQESQSGEDLSVEGQSSTGEKSSAGKKSSPRKPLSARVSLALSGCLRRMGKLLAIANAGWVITTCILQYSDIYDTCFCNSSMITRGAAAYITMTETPAQAALAQHAWIGALVLVFTSALAFIVLVTLLVDTLKLKAEPSS
jgi:hypothetical protein